MARIWMPGGGGGTDLDVVTAIAGDVLKNKVIVGPDGEPLTGTLELTGTAADSQVLNGQTYYNTDAKAKRTGTMANQGAKTASLNCGGSYTIPAGFHNGDGKIMANSLASQTSADAVAGNILSGKTAWVNGSKVTGTMAVQSILSFNVAPYGAKQVTFTWKNPAKGPFSGVIIVYKTGSYPTSITDGTRIYKGSGNNSAANGSSSATCTMPSENTTYYFRAYSYAVKDNGEWVHSTTYTATATTARSLYTFTSSGTFTVPAGCSKIDIFCVGGGGGGSGAYGTGTGYLTRGGGGGGGGGYTKTVSNVSVTAGTSYAVTVGAGGTGGTGGTGTGSTHDGTSGGTSSVGSLCSANGGINGAYSSGAGKGGSGGGSGSSTTSWSSTASYPGYNGGSNGGNGAQNNTTGKGQGTTTRAFGESSNTLYAGGGGGGSCYGSPVGQGGAGGGGNGNSSGTANTGGGGGGGLAGTTNSSGNSTFTNGGNGGSGIVIIRIK